MIESAISQHHAQGTPIPFLFNMPYTWSKQFKTSGPYCEREHRYDFTFTAKSGVNVTGPPNETIKTELPCHRKCDTMKNPY